MSSAYVEVLNRHQFETKVAGVAERMVNPSLAFAEIIRELEHEERSIFESYVGKYRLTGALEESLTSSGSGAIRHLMAGSLEFGSSLWYARFQGTSGSGGHGPPSAVLKLTPAEVAMAGKTVMEYIMHGGHL